MRKIMACILTMLFCISVSCSASGDQKTGFTGKYTYSKIQDNIYKIVFSGSGYAGEARASDFALLHFSEVTLKNEYKYFVPLQQKADIKGESYKASVDAQGLGASSVFGNPDYVYGTFNGATYYYSGQSYRFNDKETVITIACFKDKPENVPTMIYDAKQIKENIWKKYNLK
ncbi:MAG: hypothetical protein WC522_09295 [Candidatus Omnitrophota bacterium]